MVVKTIVLILGLLSLTLLAHGQNTYRLNKAPFYKTFKKGDIPPSAQIIHFPVSIDKLTKTEFFYQGREKVLQPLINEMNQYLDSLQQVPGVPENHLNSSEKGAPYLFVGSAEAETAPPGADMMREEFDKFPPMVMYVHKPSKEWKARLILQQEQSQADYGLVLWIGFNEYPKAGKGLFKKKVVLGTGYEPEIRFLSAEDKPVEVLQLSGILISKKGDVVKAGSEAFLYEDSPFWVQVLEAGTTIDDKTIHRSAYDIRRDDLPGKPLAWKVAMDHLLNQLSQRPLGYRAAR